MIDLFSMEFLANLKEEMRSKTKASKALLDAIKQLRITDQNNKKKIIELQNQIKVLKQQNQMLVQLLDTSKKDYESRILTKDKKIQNGIQIEAKLYAESQGLKKQVEKLKNQLQIIKNISITSRNSLPIDKQQQSNQQIKMNDGIVRSQDRDLLDYLYSQKDKFDPNKICVVEENDKLSDVSLEEKVEQQQKQQELERVLPKHERHPSQTDADSQALFSQILHGDDQTQ